VTPDVDPFAQNFVYGIQSGQFIKIGVARDIAKRMTIMRLHNPHGCTLVFRRWTYCAYHCERTMHEVLAAKSIGREWFEVTVQEVRAASRVGISEANKLYRELRRKEREWATKTPVVRQPNRFVEKLAKSMVT
jgi:hypothetical protein